MAGAQLVQARKLRNMFVSSSVESGDLVYLHQDQPNTVVKLEDDSQPVIGVVITTYDQTNIARILLNGIIKIDEVLENGRLYLSSEGKFTSAQPTKGNFSQDIGISFGDGTIDFHATVLNNNLETSIKENFVIDEQILDTGIIELSKLPCDPDFVSLIPECGIAQDNGRGFIVSGKQVIFKDLGLDNFFEVGEKINISYTH